MFKFYSQFKLGVVGLLRHDNMYCTAARQLCFNEKKGSDIVFITFELIMSCFHEKTVCNRNSLCK